MNLAIFSVLFFLSYGRHLCTAEEGRVSLLKRASNPPTSGSASSSIHPDLALLHSYWNQHDEWLDELNRQYPFSWDDMWLCPRTSSTTAPAEHQASGSDTHDNRQDYSHLRQLSQQISSMRAPRRPEQQPEDHQQREHDQQQHDSTQHQQHDHNQQEESARRQRQRELQERQTQVYLQQHEEYARSMQRQLRERQMQLYMMQEQQQQHEQPGQSTERQLQQRQSQRQPNSQQPLTTKRRTMSHHLAALPGVRILESAPLRQQQQQQQEDDRLSREIVREIHKQLRERRGVPLQQQQASTSTPPVDIRHHHFPSIYTSTIAGAGAEGQASGSGSREYQVGSCSTATVSSFNAINWPRDPLSRLGYERAAAIFKRQVQGPLRSSKDHKFHLSEEEKYYVGDAGEMLFRAMACRFRRERYNERRRNEQSRERRRIRASRQQQQTPPEERNDQDISDDEEGNNENDQDDDNDNDNNDDHHGGGNPRRPRSEYERSCRRLRLKLQSVERRSDGTLFTRQDLAAALALASMDDFNPRRVATTKKVLLAFLRLSSHIRHDWERNMLAQYYDDLAHDRPDLSDVALAPIYLWLDKF